MRKIFYIFILLSLGCQKKVGDAPEEDKTSSTIIEPIHPLKELNVGFLLVDGVYNTEVIAPFDIFQHTIYHIQPGLKVFTIAPSLDPITTFEGLRIKPDMVGMGDGRKLQNPQPPGPDSGIGVSQKL